MATTKTTFYHSTGLTLYLRVLRRSDHYILDTNDNTFKAAPTWANSIISATENTAVSKCLYYADITFPAGVSVCDIMILDDNAENSVPIDGFQFIADGDNAQEISLDDVLNIARCDWYIDTGKDPYEIVYHKQGDTGTEYFRKKMYQTDGSAINDLAEIPLLGKVVAV